MTIKVQLVGPMTGKPNFNYDTFDAVEQHLRGIGLAMWYSDVRIPVEPVNPANSFDRRQDLPRHQYLASSLKQVAEADAICLLPGWEDSEGAKLEVQQGLNCGLDFYAATREVGRWDTWPLTRETVEYMLNTPVAHTRRGDVYLEGWHGEHGPEVISFPPACAVAPETIEQEASRLVRNGERQKDYGHPRGDFDQIAKRWTIDLGGKLKDLMELSAEDVALMMVSLKLARLHSNPKHHDSKVDVIGYTICLDRLDEPQ